MSFSCKRAFCGVLRSALFNPSSSHSSTGAEQEIKTFPGAPRFAAHTEYNPAQTHQAVPSRPPVSATEAFSGLRAETSSVRPYSCVGSREAGGAEQSWCSSPSSGLLVVGFAPQRAGRAAAWTISAVGHLAGQREGHGADLHLLNSWGCAVHLP